MTDLGHQTMDFGPQRAEVRGPTSVLNFFNFSSRSARESSSSLRCRGFWLASNSGSTLWRERRRLSFSRQRAASSALIGGRRSADLSVASACCASTDLLSQPRATGLIIVLRPWRWLGFVVRATTLKPNESLGSRRQVLPLSPI